MAQLGIRNNNWLNVRYNPNNPWVGQTGGDDSNYAEFENPVYGIRAADKVLANYQKIHGIDNVADTINRYAPPSDNNPTQGYVNYVSDKMGVKPNEHIDLSDPDVRARMMRAMVGFETPDAASQFSDELLAEARSISGEGASFRPTQAATTGKRTFTVRDKVSGKTLKLSGTRPPTNADLQRIFAPYRDTAGGDEDRTILGQAVETVKAIPRGFGHGILSSVEGAVEVADAATNFIGLDNLIDSGDENELIRLAHAGQESLSTGFLGADEAYQDAWMTKFGEGLGSMASFMTPAGAARLAGLAGKGLRMTERLGAAGLATTMYAGEQAQRIKAARESGIEVSEGQEDAAIIAGAFAGLTELAPIHRLLSRIPKSAGYTFGQNMMKNVTEAMKSGGVEAVQEVVGLWTQNAIERGIYNENLPTGQSMWEEFTIGGAVGMTADLVLTAFSGRRARLSSEAEKNKEAKLREEVEEASKDLPNRLSRQLKDEADAAAVVDKSEDGGITPEETVTAAADEAEASSIPPETIQPPYPLRDETQSPPEGWGTEYAKKIAGTMGKDFPSNASFSVDRFSGPLGEDRFAVVSGNKQYGMSQPSYGRAERLSKGLNNEVSNERIRASVTDILRLSPQSYSESLMGDLYRYGLEIMNPESYTITSASLDEAAGTTNEQERLRKSDGKDPEIVYQETLSAKELERLGEPLRNYTASQKYNRRRMMKGLPEVYTFTAKEAKQILKDKFSNLDNANLVSETERYAADVDQNGDHYVRSSSGEQIRSRLVRGKLKPIETASQARATAQNLMKNFSKNGQIPREVKDNLKGTAKEIERLLRNKNISSSIDSPEVREMAQKMVGKLDVRKMNSTELKMLYQRLRKLPRLSETTRLPMMRARPYTKLQWSRALEAVKTSGDPSVENIQQAARFRGRKEITALEQAKALRKDLVDQGVIAKNKVVPYEQEQQARKAAETEATILEQKAREEQETAETAREEAVDEVSVPNRGLDDLRAALRKSLDSIGLTDVGINLSDVLEFSGRDADGNMVVGARFDARQNKFLFNQKPEDVTEAYYDPGVGAIFLGVDKVSQMDSKKNPMSQEQIQDALADLMNHESLHAMRKLDLFKENEWFLLENAARRLKRRDNNLTFYEEARKTYSDLSETAQMEEAVAELIRHGRRDPKLVGGKPKNLIDRVIRFLERVYSAMRGTGYQSYGDIIASLESGEIGGRERGVVRTLLETELRAGKIPERGIGISDEEEAEIRDQQRKQLEKNAKREGVSVEELMQRGENRIQSMGASLRGGKEQQRKDAQGLTIQQEIRESRRATETIDNLEASDVQTGRPVQFRYTRNTEKAPYMGSTFGQDVEPAGKYMVAADTRGQDYPSQESGVAKFDNPLVMDSGGLYQDADNWKQVLTARYGGKTGRVLSDAIRADGHDGIITIAPASKYNQNPYISEIVDLAQKPPDLRAPDILESRRASRLDERAESGSIEDFALAQGTPAQQREVSSFLEDRRIVTPADIREARHVSGNTMWRGSSGVMAEPDLVNAPPLEFSPELTPRANYLLTEYVQAQSHIPSNSQGVRYISDVLGNEITEGDWNGYRPVDNKKVFRSLINDLVINNRPYRDLIKKRLSESGIPDKFTVYRGRPKKTPRGYGKWEDDFVASVSTSREEAAKFAPILEDPVVDAYTVNYDDILALGSVKERELIVRLPTQPDSTTRHDNEAEVKDSKAAENESEQIVDYNEGYESPAIAGLGIREARIPYEVSTRYPWNAAAKKLNSDTDPSTKNGEYGFLNTLEDFIKGNSAKKVALGEPDKKKGGSIRTLANFKKSKNIKTAKDHIEWLANHAKENILFVYDRVPDEIKRVTKRWYEGANLYANRLSEDKNISVPQASGIIASLSPQMDWNTNVSLAERVIDIYQSQQNTAFTDEMNSVYQAAFIRNKNLSKKKIQENREALERIKGKTFSEVLRGEDRVDAGRWLRTYDETYNDRSYRLMSPEGEFFGYAKTKKGEFGIASWGSLKPIAGALSILQDGSVRNISRSLGAKNKVRNFYNNILNPDSDAYHVTVDTHAVSVALLQPLGGSDFEVEFNFGGQKRPGERDPRVPRAASTSNDSVNGFNGTYPIYEEAYRRAAAERGILPREMQSITWDAGRTMFSSDYKGLTEKINGKDFFVNKNAVDGFWKDYGKGRLSLDEVREKIYEHAGGIKEPDYWGSYLRSLEETQETDNERELRQRSLSRPADERTAGRRTGIDDPRLSEAEGIERSRPTVLPAEGIEEAVAQNVREGQEANAGLQPKFSQNASPEAQYVARNDDKATPLSDSMNIRYSRSASKPDYGDASSVISKYSATYVPDAHPIMTYIRETEGTWNKVKVAMTALKQRAVNNWARLEAVTQDPRLRDLYGSSSAMAAALMSDRSRGIVASALKYGVPVYKDGVMRVVNEIEGTRTGKQLTGVMDGMVPLFSNEHGKNLEEIAQAYAAIKRESSFDPEKGIVVRIDPKDLPAEKAKLQEKVDQYVNSETGRPIVEEWYEWWQDYNENTIQWLQDTGVVNAETAEIWRKHATYYPFYEQAQQNPNVQNHKEMKVFAGMTSAAQFERLKGSKNPLDVPLLEAVTRNLSAAIDMGMKNVAQQRIIRDQVEFGMARNITNQPDKHERVPVVRFMIDGTEQIYEIDDPLIHESMLAMGQGDLGWVVNNIFGPASQLLRETVTRDPAFVLVNMMRDTMSAYVTSGSNFTPVVDTVKGFFGSDMQELEMLGVVGGYDFSNDPKDVVKFMRRLAAKRGTPIGKINREGELDIGGRLEQGFEAPVLKQFKQLWQGMGAVTTRSDAATRRAVYNDVLERTGDLGEAQIQALEIINFSRRGNSALMRTLTAAIPFLNARMQGVDVLWRSFTGRYSANKEAQNMHIIRTAIFRGGTLMAATSIYYLLVSDEDEYKDARPEVRDDYFLIPLKSIGMDTVLRLPTPFEVGVIFKTIPERIIDSMVGDSTSRDVKNTVQRAITNTLEINPLQAQAVAPIIETWLNHDFYTGRSIVPMYMDQDVARGLQDTFGTRELAVRIGKALNLSPIKIDHIMTGYAGTLGVYGLDVIDAFMRTEGRIPPERRLDQYPVIKRFFASPRGGGLQAQFYELSNQVRGVVTTMNRLKRQGRYDELNAFMKTRQGLIEVRGNVNYISKEMAEYRRQRDQIQRSNFDPETKREMLELLEAEINLMLSIAPELKRIADVPAFERAG